MSHTIFYDITELVKYDKGTGIQRVTRAILNVLRLAPPSGWKLIPIHGNNEDGNFYRVLFESDKYLSTILNENIIKPMPNDIFLSVDLTYNISNKLRKTLIDFRKNGMKVFFVIYDLIPINHPNWFEGTNDWFEGNNYLELFDFWLETAVNESDGLICISESVKNSVNYWLHENIDKINNNPRLGFFHLGSDLENSIPTLGLEENTRRILKQLKMTTSFLMVGTIEPRKGHKLALETIERLWEQGKSANLVIVGREGWHVNDLIKKIKNHPQFGKQLFWFDRISDETLMEIYKSSSVLLALSEAEGFGLPLIEAGHYQLPIIARNIPIFNEVCGNGAFYINSTCSEELIIEIEQWQEDYDKQVHPKSKDIKSLSWKESTHQLFVEIGKIQNTTFKWND